MAAYLWISALLAISAFVLAVDKNNFKTCEQSSFCRRLRKAEPGQSKYELNLDTLQVTEHSVEADLVNTGAGAHFTFSLTALAGNTFRLFADETQPLHPRYQVQGALDGEPEVSTLKVLDRSKQSITVQSGSNKATIQAAPFKVEFSRDDKVVAVVNGKGLFTIEHLRNKQPEVENAEEATKEDPGAWEENFKSHHDSKPRGPEAIGIDITFPGASKAYGLPEHADRLALRTTGDGGLDPYRLYNLDVFEYELDSTMALYGSVPVLYAHGKQTVGVFWHNAAETWVDITNSNDANVVSSIVKLVSGSNQEEKVDAHFMSESGVVDLFVFMGPTPAEAIRQYAAITGVAPLPQFFTLGYHQCRWNYNDEDDVRMVVEKLDEGDFPVDVMWLDIEYTDDKKYFTWDPIKFSHPTDMIHNLTGTGRKLVAIIDPHVKRTNGYFLHDDALSNDLYVKTKDGNVYEGWCWPGASSYPDFFDPKVIEYYSSLYSLDKFKGSTEDVYIWNDMNEPSVFNGPEITMPKDLLHIGGWEHRHVHNLYGFYYTMVTHKGLLARSPNKRPFILTRAHFAGSQRVATVWTGDNAAEWSHLAASYPMCLSEAIGGISFCGADIGGFFNDPDPELLLRWYQAGAWLPLYREHAHINTKRREPYLYSTDVQTRIRNALKLRYAHLPLWYTLFFEHERTGDPVIRPLFYQYPEDAKTFDIDNQLLVGNSVMVTPVTQAGVNSISVYLPGGSKQYWYDIFTFKKYEGTGAVTVPVDLDTIPIFYKGGAIIPRKNRPRRASTLMHDDPYTLYVVLDGNKSATGTLYVDDGESYEYKKKKYLYINFNYKDGKLTSSLLDKDADFTTLSWLERVVIVGAPTGYKNAALISKDAKLALQVSYGDEDRTLTIRKPGVSIGEDFTIALH